MKKFSFNMEKILSLRKYREQEAKLELGRAVSILSGIEMNIQAVAEEKTRAASLQYDANNSVIDIMQYGFYLTRLDNTKEKLLQDAVLAEIEVERVRGIYIEASQERKVLDKLKEKKASEYRKKYFSEDSKKLDDITSGRTNRK